MEPVSWLPDWLSYPLFWLYLDQTLITGAAALAVGYFTVKAIREQIRQADDSERRRTERRHLAALAGLPLSFSEILDYSQTCWHSCIVAYENWEAYDEWDRQSAFHINLPNPTFPYEAFRNVQIAIETAAEGDADKLVDLLGFAQVHAARFKDIVAQFSLEDRDDTLVLHKGNILRGARDALELYFRASSCLRYSRRHTAAIEELPGADATEEFIFFVSTGVDDEVREYLRSNWDGQHWHQTRSWLQRQQT